MMAILASCMGKFSYPVQGPLPAGYAANLLSLPLRSPRLLYVIMCVVKAFTGPP